MPPLRVMSFNVRYGTAEDGEHSWPFRRSAAISVVRFFAPHVLGLQEALAFQIQELLDAFPNYASIGVGRDDGETEGEFAAILYDRTRLRVLESGTFWFSETPEAAGSRHPECYHPRICTWAVFEDDGGSFALYNLHLDNESHRSRLESVARLISTTAARSPLIVTGDFNAGENDSSIQALRSAGLRDSFRELHPGCKAGITFHSFGSQEEAERIDYIWIDPSWSLGEARIVDGQIDGRWPSDHFPVTATLDRRTPSEASARPLGLAGPASP